MSKMNEKGRASRHTAIKFQNPKNRENTIKDLEASCLWTSFIQFYNARRSWNRTFKISRENYFHYSTHAQLNHPLKNEGKIKAFLEMQDSIFISYVSLLKNLLEDVLQLNGKNKEIQEREK